MAGILRSGSLVLILFTVSGLAWAGVDADSLATIPDTCSCLEPVADIHPLQEAVAMFLVPKLFQDTYVVREFIVSDEFQNVRRLHGDRVAVDVLFRRALHTSWNNPYLTLAVITLAVFDHRRFGVRVPFLGPLFWFPLTSEFAEEFSARRAALPSRLYPDSPSYGDRDKLQHFFGAALVAVLTNSHETVDRVGSFIEWGEDRFIVEGTLEERDMEANSRGGWFGLALLENRTVLPSAFMKTPLNVPRTDPGRDHEEARP